jgi:hypothetical protein
VLKGTLWQHRQTMQATQAARIAGKPWVCMPQTTGKQTPTLAATDEESVPVIWTELVGVNFDPARGLLTKDRAARQGWNSGAVSVQRLEAGEDGWFETELRGRV